jgi:hypothetical protein
MLEAKPSKSTNWKQRLARSAIPAFDRIAGLCYRHQNSNWDKLTLTILSQAEGHD